MRKWDMMVTMLAQGVDAPELAHLPDGFIDRATSLHKEHTPTIKRLFLFVGTLCMLWDVQLVITTLYYHTLPHKVLAFVCACVCHTATYGTWYVMH